jgi:hypothetical protein
MRTLTDREKRTLRAGVIAIVVYLVLFYGSRGWKQLEGSRRDYQQLALQAQTLKYELQSYETKTLLTEKLRKTFNLNPANLSKTNLVAEASAAIQKAATTGGVQLGPIRESPPRPTAKELASMQLEASGPPTAILALLHRLEGLGFPLVLDAVQITVDPTKPGMVKLNLTIVIPDFKQWKDEEIRHA